MNESDSCVVSPGSWFLINQRRSFLEIRLYLRFHIIDFKADVVDSLAFGLQEFHERRILPGRLDQFNIGLPNLEKPHPCLLGGNHFNP